MRVVARRTKTLEEKEKDFLNMFDDKLKAELYRTAGCSTRHCSTINQVNGGQVLSGNFGVF